MSNSYPSLPYDATNWKKENQLWRREPPISPERQEFLQKRLDVISELKQAVYPFKGVKLSRADLEWLLATHEKGHGPIDGSDESQQERKGLDLRGADLQQVDLSDLPLANMEGGLTANIEATSEKREEAAVNLEGADLRGTHLERAELSRARLSKAMLLWGHLEGADLQEACLEGADLRQAHLDEANLFAANLKQANLRQAHLEKANLFAANLEQADLGQAYLERANLRRANLSDTNLEGANLSDTNLEGANLSGACLQEVRMDLGTRLGNVRFDSKTQLGDVLWNGVPLTRVDWQQISMLGDEADVTQTKSHADYVQASHNAIRANRQLAAILRDQGIDEHADRFAYRTHVLHRRLLLQERKFGQYLFSLLLDMLTGYGYKLGRSIFAYLVTVAGFAIAYYLLGQIVRPYFSLVGAIIFSLASFHGRGFFPSGITLDNPVTALAAIEALVGLIIEIGFLLVLARRLLMK